MKKETVNQEQQVLIPMVVDKALLLENGMMVGIKKSDIKKWTIGCHKVDVVLVPGTQEQYNDIMNTYYREFKAEDRDTMSGVILGSDRMDSAVIADGICSGFLSLLIPSSQSADTSYAVVI